MPATLAQLRAAIKAKVVAVANMGQVHDYERFVKEPSKLAQLYKSSAQTGDRIYGWHIRRTQTVERLTDVGRNYEDHAWRLRGFMSLDDADATEKKFDDQIELMRDAFRADLTLGGLCDTHFKEANGNVAGLQLEESEPVLFCGVLCHAAKLGLVTRVYTNT